MFNSIRMGAVALMSLAALASCNDDADRGVVETKEVIVDKANNSADAAREKLTEVQEAVIPTGPLTSLTFDETTYNFGTVNAGEKVRHTYRFTNTGDEPLVLSNARGSCGCTVPKWPKEPIAPGESGEILVEFNSQGKKGAQNRMVTVTANTAPAQSKIYIKGEVVEAVGSPLVQ